MLLTPGGGEDGYHLIDIYLHGLETQHSNWRSLIISGSEMSADQREQLQQRVAHLPSCEMLEFTDDLVGYMDAADLVVSMGGYNTIGEILSLQKRAIVVPRLRPVEEQWLRAERMAKMGLFQAIHPDNLTSSHLMQFIRNELQAIETSVSSAQLDMNALPRIAKYLSRLVCPPTYCPSWSNISHPVLVATADC